MHLPSMIMQLDSILDTQQPHRTGSFTPAQGYALAMAPEDLPPPPSGGVPGTTVAFTGAMQTTSQGINIVNNHGKRRWR